MSDTWTMPAEARVKTPPPGVATPDTPQAQPASGDAWTIPDAAKPKPWTMPQAAKVEPPEKGGFFDRMWQGITGGDVSKAGRVGMGMADPVYGAAQAGARGYLTAPEDPFPAEVPAEHRQSVDIQVKQREQQYEQGRKQFGQSGFDWNRLWGNVLSPANLAMGAVPSSAGAGIGTRLALGGMRGALGGAMQPVQDTEHYAGQKAKEVGFGAAMGAPLEAAAGAGVRTPESTERDIASIYRRTVKPTVQGTTTAEKTADLIKQSRSAIDAIVAEKPNLKYGAPEYGQTAGHLPRSMEESLQAAGQVKKTLYKAYNDAKRAAGEKGVKISFAPLVNELEAFAKDPVNIDTFPAAVRYAKQQAKIYAKRGEYTPEQAQDLVQKLNAELAGSYQSDKTAPMGTTLVNRMIANNTRQMLDDEIFKSTGAQYQWMRDQYGAIRNMETALAKRFGVYARQNPGGGVVGSMFDVMSAADIARAVVNFKTAGLGEAAINQGIKRFIQWRRSPDTMIKRMFEMAEKPVQSAPRRLLPAVGARTGQIAAPAAGRQAIQYAWPDR